MRITALTENTAGDARVTAEHGLSLYVELGERRLLFDMGQTDAFARNAQALGISLQGVDVAVLSHGHYDHGGGLETFLRINAHAPVYVNPLVFGDYRNGTEKYIGLSPSLRDEPRLIPVKGERSIGEGLTLYSANPSAPSDLRGSAGLGERVGSAVIPDLFLHEQYLLIEENGRRVLISGCSHRGIAEIAERFRPDVLIGGFHLSKMPLGRELEALAERLERLPTEYCTCHCTGEEQYAFLKERMKRLRYLSCGQSIIV